MLGQQIDLGNPVSDHDDNNGLALWMPEFAPFAGGALWASPVGYYRGVRGGDDNFFWRTDSRGGKVLYYGNTAGGVEGYIDCGTRGIADSDPWSIAFDYTPGVVDLDTNLVSRGDLGGVQWSIRIAHLASSDKIQVSIVTTSPLAGYSMTTDTTVPFGTGRSYRIGAKWTGDGGNISAYLNGRPDGTPASTGGGPMRNEATNPNIALFNGTLTFGATARLGAIGRVRVLKVAADDKWFLRDYQWSLGRSESDPRVRTFTRKVWVFGAGGGGGPATYTGTLAASHAGATFSGSAEFDAPVYTGALAASHAGAAFAGTATHTPPTYTGTLAASHAGAAFAGSATFTAPVYTGVMAASHAGAAFAGSAIFASAVFSGQLAASHAGGTLSGSATFTAPVYSGVLAATHSGAMFAGIARIPPLVWYLVVPTPGDPDYADLAGVWELDLTGYFSVQGHGVGVWDSGAPDPRWVTGASIDSGTVYQTLIGGSAGGAQVMFRLPAASFSNVTDNTLVLFTSTAGWTTPTTLTLYLERPYVAALNCVHSGATFAGTATFSTQPIAPGTIAEELVAPPGVTILVAPPGVIELVPNMADISAGHAGTYQVPAGSRRYLSMNFGSWPEIDDGDETLSSPDVEVSPSGPTIEGITVSGPRIRFWCEVPSTPADYTLSFEASLSGGGTATMTATLSAE